MKSTDPPHPAELQWLVERRNDVQELLLRIYQVSAGKRPKEYRHVDQLLTGIGFSLWRAVVLAEAGRKAWRVVEDGRKHLARVIQTNAITFSDDHKWRSWSSGYYLDSALLRLDLAYRELKLQTDKSRRVAGVFSIPLRMLDRPSVLSATMLWELAFEATSEVLAKVDTRATKPVREYGPGARRGTIGSTVHARLRR